MNTTDLSNITDPSIAQPFTGPSLNFVQNSTKEIVGATVQSMIGDVPSSTIPYVMYGLIKTSLGGNDYSYTAGAVYYNGEVYLFDAVASITINDTDVFSITITQDATADPLTFTDEVARNVHNIRKVTVADAASGSAEFDFSELIFINEKYHRIGDAGEPAYQNAWVASTTTDVAGVGFKMERNGVVRLSGSIKSGVAGTIGFTLPVGYRPLKIQSLQLTTSLSFSSFSQCFITLNGDVIIHYSGAVGDISFDGVTFSLY